MKIVLFLLFLVFKECNGQPGENLLLGSEVPEIKFKVFDKVDSSSLYAYRGKLIVIDFWATWCTSCLEKFPILDSVQNEFKDKIQILLVNTVETGDDEIKVKLFYENWRFKYGTSLGLPTIVRDKQLFLLFKHKYLPHYVWINANGIVIAITTAEFFTRENIVGILKNMK